MVETEQAETVRSSRARQRVISGEGPVGLSFTNYDKG
jgi:hypothetical protein